MDTKPLGQTIGLPKKPTTTYINNNILESLRAIGGGVGKTVAKDVVGRASSDALRSIFGTIPQYGELKPNQTIEVGREHQPYLAVRRPEVITRQAYVRIEEAGIAQKVEAVRVELQGLTKAVKSLNSDIEKAVSEVPVHPGTYHVNYFERLKSLIQGLRQQVEDSRSWLNLWSGRKRKIGYWGKYKKHGTKFGLSSERTLATQAG